MFKEGLIINNNKNNIILIVILTILSALIYFIQFLIFHQTENTLFYLLQDLAFVPIQVVMVTIILNRFLNIMENRKKIKKINVIISTFFVEAGISIMTVMSRFNRNNNEFCKLIKVEELNKKNDYRIKNLVKEFPYDIYANPDKLEELALILAKYKSYTLDMLGNSNLLEHDSFTDMLWATFHVADELQTRGDFINLNKSDIDHLSVDISRAYVAIILEWINYMSYLHDEYPFLYSLAIRKNPFVVYKI